MMNGSEALRRYESATGLDRGADEALFMQAKGLCDDALDAAPDDPEALLSCGYLLECHAVRELRRAERYYERAIELSPEWDKPRFQLTLVKARLLATEEAIDLYKHRVADAPDKPREYRFLLWAYLHANESERAAEVARAGLEVAPHDPHLIEGLGEARAALGHGDEALELWRRAGELDPELISPHYSAVFLLQKVGRLAEAAAKWRYIIAWLEARDYSIEAEWPKRELAAVEAKLAGSVE